MVHISTPPLHQLTRTPLSPSTINVSLISVAPGESADHIDGSGSVDGSLGIETVRFGSLTSTSQYFGAATHVSSSFNNNPATGLCGLAYKSIASTRQNPLHVNLYNQGQLAAAKFGFRLTRGTSNGAELTMGGIASDYASSTFVTTPVTSKTYWEVATNGMSVKNAVVSSGFPAAIDTGTTVSQAII